MKKLSILLVSLLLVLSFTSTAYGASCSLATYYTDAYDAVICNNQMNFYGKTTATGDVQYVKVFLAIYKGGYWQKNASNTSYSSGVELTESCNGSDLNSVTCPGATSWSVEGTHKAVDPSNAAVYGYSNSSCNGGCQCG